MGHHKIIQMQAFGLIILMIGLLGLTSTVALAEGSVTLDQPGEREFVLDHAGLLNREQTEQVRLLSETLLNETAIPLIIVTIERKSDYGGASMTIEQFARTLYDQWGIGQIKIGETDYNRGILLIVARSDREARIELGGGYADRMNEDAQWIMDNRIVSRFKADDYGGGIVAGANALSEMARGELETSGLFAGGETPGWFYPVIIIGIVLAAFTAISLHRSGKHGWAFLFWGVLFMLIVALLRNSGRNSRGGGGGFGGGSFGGGSSGGGGATGRW